MNLPVYKSADGSEGGGCGTSCGAGLEKIYPSMAVRFGAMSRIGEFSYRPGTVFKCGAKVVIQTDRGIELGQQVSLSCGGCSKAVSREQVLRYVQNSGPEFYELQSGRILREATERDLAEQAQLDARRDEDREHCALLAAQLQLDMNLVASERTLGGERLVFYFKAPDRVDFRELVRLLAAHHRARIEMRQVKEREEARLVADYEICGRECCCKNFLKKMRPVSMKMAKLQKSTLDPSKVSGRCGRLRCCLRYEHEGYEELARKLPPQGASVDTAFGSGVVIDRQILTQLVLVRTDDGKELTIPCEELLAVRAPTRRPESFDEDAADAESGADDAPPRGAPPSRRDDAGGADEIGRPGRRRRGRRGPGGPPVGGPPDAP